MKIVINEIAVDLLPMQRGGNNGGAKSYIIDLISTLANENTNVVFNCYCYSFMKMELKSKVSRENIKIHTVTRLSKYFWRPYDSKILFCPFGAASIPVKSLPILSILYDLQVKSYPQFFPRKERKSREQQLQYIKDKASRIISISSFTRQEALKHGFDNDKINIIPINVDYTEQGKTDTYGEKIREHKDIILYPANLWQHKNHELLFTAFAIAVDKGLSTDISLVCTGFGDETRVSYLNSIIKGMNMENRITLAGYVENTELMQLYSKSLCLIFPSLYEGFGIPVIEAMSLGVPVCCSNTTGLGEVSSDAAITFDPRNPVSIADVIYRISSDINLRKRYIAKGYNQALIYSNRDGMVREYSKAINQTYSRNCE